MRRFLNHHSKGVFIDLRKPRLMRRLMQSGRVLGFVANGEFWISDHRLEMGAGGAQEALALKKEMFRRRPMVTDRRGAASAMRRPADGARPFFFVIRRNAKRPQGVGQALA